MQCIIPAWISLPVLVFFYKPLVRIFPKMNRDSYVRRVVAVGNRYFYKKFCRIPYARRMLFLPYCLRAGGCPTIIDQERGLLCPDTCKIVCRLRDMKNMAQWLGYQDVFIVVSGRMHKKDGVLRSRDFLVRQITEHAPEAVIGCLCTKDLREKYLRPENVSPQGSLGRHGNKVIPQVCLLTSSNCRQSGVDWQQLEKLIKSHCSS